jgi:RNA polymerase sigma-70 factor (ECF subfamily)
VDALRRSRRAEPQPAEDEGLDEVLLAAIAKARAAYPGLRPSDDALLATIRARIVAEPDPWATARELALEDLVLASACAAGDPVALRAVEAEHQADVRATLRRRGLRDLDLDEAEQLVRAELFAPRDGQPPRIAGYSGRGRLRGYLRAVAGRVALRVIAARRIGETLDDAAPMDPGDLELDLLKRRYGVAFHDAFQAAFAALSAEDRFTLKQRFAKGLGVAEVGALLGVHATTASRRIADARARLVAGTREQMTTALGVGRAEASSLMRLIHREVEVTLTTGALQLDDALSG